MLSLTGPMWFHGIDSAVQGVFAFVNLIIALLSYKVYCFTKEKKYYYFSIAYLTLAGAFLSLAASIFIIASHAWPRFAEIMYTFDFSYFFHIFLTLFGYLGILLVVMRINAKRVIMFIVSLMLIFLLFSYQNYLKFHIVSFVLLFFIALQFYINLHKTRRFNTGLIFTAFYMMVCAEAFFLVALYFPSFYVIARILQLGGFSFLAYVFLRVLRHG